MSVIVLRHASAGDRDEWQGDDRLRPLDKRGRKQAERLRDVLLAHDVTRVLSSPYVRCTQTVAPLGLDIETDDRLAEGASPESTLELLADLDGAVACTHGDVIEALLGRNLRKGGAVVLDGGREIEEIPAP
jgi:phosphohistidine phosphatase SixA